MWYILHVEIIRNKLGKSEVFVAYILASQRRSSWYAAMLFACKMNATRTKWSKKLLTHSASFISLIWLCVARPIFRTHPSNSHENMNFISGFLSSCRSNILNGSCAFACRCSPLGCWIFNEVKSTCVRGSSIASAIFGVNSNPCKFNSRVSWL